MTSSNNDAWDKVQRRNRTVFGATWSNDGTSLACGDNFGTIAIWNGSEKTVWRGAHKPINAGAPTSASVYCLKTLPDSLCGHLVSGGMDGDTVIWKWPSTTTTEQSSEVARLKKHSDEAGEVNGVAVVTGRTNAVVCACGTYGRRGAPGVGVVYDIERAQAVGVLRGHTKALLCVSAAGNDCVVTGGEDGALRLWDLRTFECTGTFTPKGAKWVSCVEADAAGTQVVCGGGGGGACEVSCCLLPSLLPLAAAAPLPAPLQAAKYAEDGTLFCGYGNTVVRYNASFEPISTYDMTGVQTVYDIALTRQVARTPELLLLAQISQSVLVSKIAVVGEGSCVEVIESDVSEPNVIEF